MKTFKKILLFFTEPLKLTVNRGFSEKTIKIFNLHGVIIYIVAALITALILLACYF